MPSPLTPTRLLAVLSCLLVLLLPLLFLHPHHPKSLCEARKPSPPREAAMSSPTAAHFLSLSAGANATIAANLRALTAGPHLAGTASAAAATAHVVAGFHKAGLQTLTCNYTPLLSYPGYASLSLLRPSRSLLARLSLAEPADAERRFVPPYHAYSPSGAAVAEAVYVNLGREEDYAELERLGVAVRGRVAVARRGGGYRGGVVARAAARGAVAVLIAGDAAGGVERGTVILGGPGDPLTPGWAAAGETERLGFEDEAVRRRFPTIPSMPVPAATAAAILRSLGGPALPVVWRAGLGLGLGLGLGVEVGGVGPSPTLVNFTYQEDRKLTTIQDVFAIVRGYEEPDRYVILGNHRDAWTYGAVDPNSGTSALLDIARRLGIMLRSGWTPRRTIILSSWDAEEFGMIGSTEWVEENLGDLYSKAVAYLNVDCAVQGLGFFASSSPQLDKLLIDATKQVKDPDVEGKTVYHTWVAMNGGTNIERLARADSDFTSFLHHAGIPSVDLYYGKEFSGYHTALDSYIWMENHGDPLFLRHLAITEIWGLVALRLADDRVLPFDYRTYASQLEEHTSALAALMNDSQSFKPINACIHDLADAAKEVLKEAELDISNEFTLLRRRSLNDRLLLAERSFLEAEGLEGRGWFKHLLYSPPEDYESKLSFFPGIADALSRSRNLGPKEAKLAIQHEMWKVARAIQRAASVLRGEVSQRDVEMVNFTTVSAAP